MPFIPNDRDWPPFQDADMGKTETFAAGMEDSIVDVPYQNCYAPNIVGFEVEPAGVIYQTLLRIAKSHMFAFSLVWRDSFKFAESATCLTRDLQPWLCYERYTQEWLGMALIDGWALVRWYRVTEESLALIANPGSLYGWLWPAYPEDLAFYRHDGKPWLGSIAHEGIGWLDLDRLDRRVSKDFLRMTNPSGVRRRS